MADLDRCLYSTREEAAAASIYGVGVGVVIERSREAGFAAVCAGGYEGPTYRGRGGSLSTDELAAGTERYDRGSGRIYRWINGAAVYCDGAGAEETNKMREAEWAAAWRRLQ